MGRRVPAGLILCSLVLTACGGLRDRVRSGQTPAPASTEFNPGELVDVLEPDQIPAIDRPKFESVAAARGWLKPDEPVVVVEVKGDARAYPLAIMTWHEIVNDTVGGRALSVTYCPLCNSAIAFDRTIGGRPDTFGTSGKLYRSDLVMYDRRTRSLWPQIHGAAVQGPLEGTTLERVPSQISSLEEFEQAYPSGRVLSRDTGFDRGYGRNPYQGYDTREGPYGGFFALPADRRLPSMERVVGVVVGDEARAYPYSRLAGGVVSDRLGGRGIVIFWRPGTRSALDSPLIAEGRTVGSAGVFSPVLDGRALSFEASGGGIRDRETGSAWSVLGAAVRGPLDGKRLDPVHFVDTFWFAWAAFVPFTTVFGS